MAFFQEITYLEEKITHTVFTHTIFRIQDNDSIMCGFYCIAFTEYMLAGKNLLRLHQFILKRMTK